MLNSRLALCTLLGSLSGLTCGPTPTGDPCSGSSVTVVHSELCTQTCGVPPCCAPEQARVCCACVQLPNPAQPAVRTFCPDVRDMQGNWEYCDLTASGPADLSCFATPPVMPTRGTATVHGLVDVFGSGVDSHQVTVTFYEEGLDGALGPMVAQALATTHDAGGARNCPAEFGTCAEYDPEMPGAPTRLLGYYEATGVPTGIPLIIKTSGDPGFWRELYAYGTMFGDPDPLVDPAAVHHNVRVLSVDDYVTLPLIAGDDGGIGVGRGAVAGEIHDCGDKRLSRVTVGVQTPPSVLTYFSNNPDQPLPVATPSTGLLGLFAAIDTQADPAGAGADVTAIGHDGTDYVLVGWYHVRVFSDSVTSVTLRGLRPWQIP